MATRETKVTAGEVVSETVRYTNKDDDSRIFDITADVYIQDKKVTNFNQGSLTKTDSQNYGSANFNAGSNLNYFNFNSNGFNEDEVKQAVNDVLVFISKVEENIESKAAEQ